MKVGVIGASGRMGQAVITALEDFPDATLAAAVVSKNSKVKGQQVGALSYQSLDQLRDPVDVFIDFSLPQALADNLHYAVKHNTPLVVCSTGLSEQQQQWVRHSAQQLPLLYARNTSVGITLLEQLVALSAAAMTDADIEIFEAHHKFKNDAPSGTAIALGEAAAHGRQQSLSDVDDGIRGGGQRQAGRIGFSVMRAADIIGEHQVTIAQPGERIELGHRVTDRNIFARGALQAAQWLQTKEPGYYCMQDMLELKTTLQRLLADGV